MIYLPKIYGKSAYNNLILSDKDIKNQSVKEARKLILTTSGSENYGKKMYNEITAAELAFTTTLALLQKKGAVQRAYAMVRKSKSPITKDEAETIISVMKSGCNRIKYDTKGISTHEKDTKRRSNCNDFVAKHTDNILKWAEKGIIPENITNGDGGNGGTGDGGNGGNGDGGNGGANWLGYVLIGVAVIGSILLIIRARKKGVTK